MLRHNFESEPIMPRVQFLFGFCTALLFAASACTKTGAPRETTSNSDVYTRAIYSKVLTFDPALMTDTASLSVANQIYDGLLEFGQHFEILPALADRWETSRDGKAITFHLRSGAQFHDGTKVTSADCVDSFERLLANGSVVEKYYDLIQGADEFRSGKSARVIGLEAPDPETFIIRLKNKFPPFVTVLAGATAKILPKAQLKEADFFKNPVGSGAFRLVRANDTEVLLARNEHYWREPARLETLRFLVADESEGMRLAESGKVHDLVTFPFNGDEPIFSQSGGQHLQIPVIATWILGLNTRLKPFDRKAVRAQFKAAFSADDFVQKFYPGQIPARGGYIPPGLPGYLASSKGGTSAKAPSLVVREPVRIVIPELLSKAPAMKRYIEDRLRKAGFQAVTVELASWESQEARYNAKTMQSFLMSQNADYPDPEFLVRNFASTNPDNFSGLRSEKVDKLIERARETDSRQERAKLYEKLAHTLNDEALTVNLLHYRAHYWFSPCVRGIELNSLGDVYLPYRKLYLESNCARKRAEVADAR
jgi:ABC-type transport system substrate-binding protein